MKIFLEIALIIVFVIYFSGSVLYLFKGVSRIDCMIQPSRLSIAFPSFKLGCYLGDEVGEDNYYWRNR